MWFAKKIILALKDNSNGFWLIGSSLLEFKKIMGVALT